jgi:hypothetical protein
VFTAKRAVLLAGCLELPLQQVVDPAPGVLEVQEREAEVLAHRGRHEAR